MDKNVKISFINSIDVMQREVHNLSERQGFWLNSNIGEKIALAHSELSEALEADRSGGLEKPSTKIQGLSEFEEELADAVIRIMDLAHHEGCQLGDAIIQKHEFNKTRAYRHGKSY